MRYPTILLIIQLQLLLIVAYPTKSQEWTSGLDKRSDVSIGNGSQVTSYQLETSFTLKISKKASAPIEDQSAADGSRGVLAKVFQVESSAGEQNLYYSSSKLTNLIVDKENKLLTVEQTNDRLGGGGRVAEMKQQWDLARSLKYTIDLTNGDCETSSLDGESSKLFSTKQLDPETETKDNPCDLSRGVEFIYGEYDFVNDWGQLERRQSSILLDSNDLLRWLVSEVDLSKDQEFNSTHYRLNGTRVICDSHLNLATGERTSKAIRLVQTWDNKLEVNSSLLIEPGRSSSLEINLPGLEESSLFQIEIRRVSPSEELQDAALNGLQLYSDVKFCHESIGQLELEYPTLSTDNSVAAKGYQKSTLKLVENLIQMYQLDSRRIVGFLIDDSRQQQTGSIGLKVELLEGANKFVRVEEERQKQVKANLDVSEANLRRMLNISSIKMATSNRTECLDLCRKHATNCDTVVFCPPYSECHIYLFPVNLPGSFGQLAAGSRQPVCETTELKSRHKPLAGWSLREVANDLARREQIGPQDNSKLALELETADGVAFKLQPSWIKFRIVNNNKPIELDIPANRYELIARGKQLEPVNATSNLVSYSPVDFGSCLDSCDKFDTCQTVSYCQSSQVCTLSQDPLILEQFGSASGSSINYTATSRFVNDSQCFVAGKILLSQFHETLIDSNKQTGEQNVSTQVDLIEINRCAAKCLNFGSETASNSHCNSFDVCLDQKTTCHLNQNGTSARQKAAASCKTFERDLLMLFDQLLGHRLPDADKTYQKSVGSLEECSRACLGQDDCGAFEFCTSRGAGYMEFNQFCSIGSARTKTSSPSSIKTSNNFCSVFKLTSSRNWLNLIWPNNTSSNATTIDPKKERSTDLTIFVYLFAFLIGFACVYLVRRFTKESHKSDDANQVSVEHANQGSAVTIELGEIKPGDEEREPIRAEAGQYPTNAGLSQDDKQTSSQV